MELPALRIIDLVDILLFAVLVYYMYRLMKGTAAMNIFLGLVVIYVVYEIARVLEMELISKVLGAFSGVVVLALIVVFQQEIRRFLLILGSNSFKSRKRLLRRLNLFKRNKEVDHRVINAVLRACKNMSLHKTGALIVIQKGGSLEFIKNTGDKMDIKVNSPIIRTVFFKNSPLHDGAMVIEGNRITATRAILPVSENRELPARYGLRHRAALGLSERSNAVAIIVSEENGNVSLAYDGRLRSFTDVDQMGVQVKKILS